MAEFTSASAAADVSVDALWSAAGDILYATADDAGTVLTIGDTSAVLQVSGGVPDWVATSGTGSVARVTSPTFVTPALGTPSALVLTSATGLPVGGLANGTDGQLITWGTDAVATVVAVGTSTHVLTSNGAGNPPTFQAAAGGKNVGFILALS